MKKNFILLFLTFNLLQTSASSNEYDRFTVKKLHHKFYGDPSLTSCQFSVIISRNRGKPPQTLDLSLKDRGIDVSLECDEKDISMINDRKKGYKDYNYMHEHRFFPDEKIYFKYASIGNFTAMFAPQGILAILKHTQSEGAQVVYENNSLDRSFFTGTLDDLTTKITKNTISWHFRPKHESKDKK